MSPMPPNPIVDLLRALRRGAAWAMFASLVVGLPLQALSSTLAGLLGPRHGHRAAPSMPSTPSQERSDDPMAGWRDFRRANYEHRAVAASEANSRATAHHQAHEAGRRHRHAPDEIGVVDLEAPADGDATPTGSSPVGAAFAPAADGGRLAPTARSAADGAAVWRAAIARSFATPLPRRIERPPIGA